MKKTSLLWLFALAVIAGISPGASGAGCFETYKSHVEALKQKTITPEQRDDLHRWALRA